MAVIDLRDDARLEYTIARGLGQDINAGINEYKRKKLEAGIVGVLQRGAAENLSPDQMRQELLKLPNMVSTQIGQEIAMRELNTGRYFQTDLDTKQKEANITLTEARTDYYKGGGSTGGVNDLIRQNNYWNDVWLNSEPGSKEEKEALSEKDRIKGLIKARSGGVPMPVETPSPEEKAAREAAAEKEDEKKEQAKAQPAPTPASIDPYAIAEKSKQAEERLKQGIVKGLREQPPTQFGFGASGARYKPPATSKADMQIEKEIASSVPTETTTKRLPGETIEEYLARVR
jgi:hypothetical protein